LVGYVIGKKVKVIKGNDVSFEGYIMRFLLASRTTFIAAFFAIAAVFTTSCGSDNGQNLQIPGVKGPTLTLQDDKVLIAMVFENIELQGGLRYAIPEYGNSYIEVSPDLQSSGTLMSVSISISDVFDDNLQLLPPQSLPGGRALPGVSTGRLPAVAFSIPQWKNMAFYLGPKFFGMFIPLKIDIGQDNIVSARFYAGKVRAGNLSIVGPDANGENSGFVLLLDLSSTVKRKLKRLI
jgi:hypothetical protein